MDELKFKYKKNKNNEIIITRLKTKNVTRIDIPSEIDGMKVVAIAKGAFSQKDTVKIVTVPDTVTSIGRDAFWAMTRLQELIINAKIEEIPREMVAHCPFLVNFKIPETVKRIGAFAFTCDYSLPSIEIPDGVEIIDEFAFDNCRSIRQIYFPDSVKYIGNAVVNGCSDLKSIYCYKSTEITNVTFSETDKKILTVLN